MRLDPSTLKSQCELKPSHPLTRCAPQVPPQVFIFVSYTSFPLLAWVMQLVHIPGLVAVALLRTGATAYRPLGFPAPFLALYMHTAGPLPAAGLWRWDRSSQEAPHAPADASPGLADPGWCSQPPPRRTTSARGGGGGWGALCARPALPHPTALGAPGHLPTLEARGLLRRRWAPPWQLWFQGGLLTILKYFINIWGLAKSWAVFCQTFCPPLFN